MRRKLSKPKLLVSFSALLIVIMLAYTACQKQYNPGDKDSGSLIDNARNWFTNYLVKNEKEMIAQPNSILPGTDFKRKFARMQGLSALLNWDKAREYSQDGIHYVITPVNQDIKPLSNKNFEAARSLAFYKDESGKMHINVIEMLSKKGGTLGGSIQQIARIAFANKYLGKNSRVLDVNADIIFYNEGYNHESSFQITNGSWAKANISIENKKEVPQKQTDTPTAGLVGLPNCQTWYVIGFWYDLQTGEIIDYEILSQWEECTEGGSGGGGYGSDPEPGDPSQQCIDENMAALDALSSGAMVANETISYQISSINDFTKNKNPKWIILSGGPSFWKLVSIELGIVKLVDVATNKWQWESIVHGSISKEGVVIGGQVAIESETGTPSFTAGTQNILYAGMLLDYTVKYTATPIPCPPFNMIIPPVYVSYQSNAIWPATP